MPSPQLYLLSELILAVRSCRFPVMFLSGCGLYPHVDARRTSVPAALAVAATHKMAGEHLHLEVRTLAADCN